MALVRASIDPFDLASLFALRGLLDDLRDRREPTLLGVTPLPRARAVALLPGSFNPPTAAHVLLAERALAAGCDAVVFVTAVQTVGKPPFGLTVEDRLLTMRAAGADRILTAACSHGLYAEQAEAAAQAFPGADLVFLVGSDKVEQILDHAWYDDRDVALTRLFDRARLLAAPRGSTGEQVRDLLALPRNERWASYVDVLPLHPAVADLSSTRVRGLLGAGADPAGLVPGPVSPLLAEMHAFAPPLYIDAEEVDAYGLRARLLDLLWALRHDLGTNVDMRHLMRVALSRTDAGRRFRSLVLAGEADAGALVRAQRAVGV